MTGLVRGFRWDRAAGLLTVIALHGLVLYTLWSTRVMTPPAGMTTLFVNFVTPEAPKRSVVEPPPKPKPKPRERPVPPEPHRHLAANAPIVLPTEAVEPIPDPEPSEPDPGPPEPPAPPAPPAPPPALPMGPVTLGTELAVACPERTPPVYPPVSRRLGETGTVVLRVELDETGRVRTAQVQTSSGSSRLDAAALAAVRTWRCEPAQRQGRAVGAVATQPFKFTLEGR
ncbi:MAG TPA: TonB family protein [Thiobacillaceae bacterium]|nr:TonB family protein [Thiobacillaceae bacterium]